MSQLEKVNTDGYFTKVYHNVKKLQGKTGRFTTDRKLVLSNLIQKYENMYEKKEYTNPHLRNDNPYHFYFQQVELCKELTLTKKGLYKIMQFLQDEGYITYFSTNKEGYIYKATYVLLNVEFLNKKIKELTEVTTPTIPVKERTNPEPKSNDDDNGMFDTTNKNLIDLMKDMMSKYSSPKTNTAQSATKPAEEPVSISIAKEQPTVVPVANEEANTEPTTITPATSTIEEEYVIKEKPKQDNRNNVTDFANIISDFELNHLPEEQRTKPEAVKQPEQTQPAEEPVVLEQTASEDYTDFNDFTKEISALYQVRGQDCEQIIIDINKRRYDNRQAVLDDINQRIEKYKEKEVA